MAPVRIYNIRRDATSSDPPKLDTGAIIGIACGIGALFLGSFVLFFIYWRRTRQFELEDAYEPHDLDNNPFAATSPPAFTLDHKQPTTTDEKNTSASYSVAPELLRTDPRRLSPIGGFVSAMPTHPAYIPRTVIRGSTPQPSRSLTPTTEEPDNLTPRSQTALLPAAPAPVRARSKSRPADALAQAYLIAADGERVPSSLFRHATASSSTSDRDPSPAPPRSHSSQSTTPRALPLRTSSLPQQPQPQPQPAPRPRPPRSPPRLNLEMGLERRPIALRDPPHPPPAGRSITKPLAVLPLEMNPPAGPTAPMPLRYYQEQEDEPPSEDHRAFRDRADMIVVGVEAPPPPRRQQSSRRESTSRRIGDWIANNASSLSSSQQQHLARRGPQYHQEQQPPPSAGDDRLWS